MPLEHSWINPMTSATMRFLHIIAYIVKAIFLCISLRKALALRETNAANNSQQSSHIIGILWDVQSIETYFQNGGLFLSNQRWDYFTSSWNKKADVLRSLTHWMINICSPCWWTDMWWWSWGIQIFPNIGGHIAPGISDWTFWGSPLPWYISPRAALSSFFASLPKFIFVILKLKTENEYVWLFSSEVGFIDDGSSLLVVGFAFAFVRFAYFALIIRVLSGLVCNLHIDDQTLTKINSRKTKHFYLSTFALGSTDWEHTKRPPPLPLIQWGPYTLDSHQL